MVNFCVSAGCTNSSLLGHRVHRNGASFHPRVHAVQVKRRDFTPASVTKNVVVCSAHFYQWTMFTASSGWDVEAGTK